MFCRKIILSVAFSILISLSAEEGVPTAPGSEEEERASGEAPPEKEEVIGPSDSASLQLFENYAKVTGMASAPKLKNIRASGVFTYAKEAKDFELVETSDGVRCLTLEWRLMGRTYREQMKSLPGVGEGARDLVSREISKMVIVRGGERSWERVFLELRFGTKLMYRNQFGTTVVSAGASVRAKPLTAHQKAVVAGGYGEVSIPHFRSVFLLSQPIFSPSEREMGYRYEGVGKRFGRPAYIVRHFSGQNFYFDRDKFLLVQWGGPSRLGGQELKVDYRSRAFRRQGAILLPSEVLLVAEDAVLGSYKFDQVELNAVIESDLLEIPEYESRL